MAAILKIEKNDSPQPFRYDTIRYDNENDIFRVRLEADKTA